MKLKDPSLGKDRQTRVFHFSSGESGITVSIMIQHVISLSLRAMFYLDCNMEKNIGKRKMLFMELDLRIGPDSHLWLQLCLVTDRSCSLEL